MKMKYQGIDKIKTAQRIKQLMADKGLTPLDVQKTLNLTVVQTIYHWMSARSLPSIDHLLELSVLFGVSVDDIVCESSSTEDDR